MCEITVTFGATIKYHHAPTRSSNHMLTRYTAGAAIGLPTSRGTSAEPTWRGGETGGAVTGGETEWPRQKTLAEEEERAGPGKQQEGRKWERGKRGNKTSNQREREFLKSAPQGSSMM